MKRIVKVVAAFVVSKLCVCVLQLVEPYRETALSEADGTFMTAQSHFILIFVFCLFQVIVRLSSVSTVCITATKLHFWSNK